MNDPEIDRLLDRGAHAKPEPDSALLDRVTGAIGSSLSPVRPLAPAWMLSAALVLWCAAMALAGGFILKPHGVQHMDSVQRLAIFPLLGLLISLGSAVAASQMVPGSRRVMAPSTLALCACLLLAAVFGAVFPDHRLERFVPEGLKCLTAGLAQAIPAAAGMWWILRRGFAVDSLAAGFAQGALAGLAGVAMLELHCPNFELLHILVWHIAVLPVAGLLGMAVARWRSARQSA